MTGSEVGTRPVGPLLAGAALLVILVAVPYAQTTSFEFVGLDDNRYILDNEWVREGLGVDRLQRALTQAYAMNWHPLTWASHMADVSLFGLEAGAHHRTSVVLHGLAAVLLFLAVARLTGSRGASWFVAALFAVHPQHVESVAWVSERKDVLSAVFFALTLWAYAKAARGGSRLGWSLVVLFLALGLMAKPMLVTVPLVLLLLDGWPLRRSASPGRLLLEKVPLLVLSVAVCGLTLWAQRQGGAVRSLEALPLEWRLVNTPLAYVAYLGKAVWPTGLACFYPHPGMLADTVSGGHLTGALLAAGALLGVTLVAVWRGGPLRTGWLWYLGMLVPVIGLAQVGEQGRADRYTYLPMVGVYLAVTFGVRAWVGDHIGRRRMAVALGAAAVLALTAVAHRQTGTWRDDRALFGHALAATANNYLAHYNLGHRLQQEGEDDAAIEHYGAVLEIRPRHARAHNNLGTIRAQEGQVEPARIHFQQAVESDPDNAEARLNLGMTLARLGRLPEARLHLERALELDPGLEAARATLQRVRQRMGQ